MEVFVGVVILRWMFIYVFFEYEYIVVKFLYDVVIGLEIIVILIWVV